MDQLTQQLTTGEQGLNPAITNLFVVTCTKKHTIMAHFINTRYLKIRARKFTVQKLLQFLSVSTPIFVADRVLGVRI